MNLTKIAKTVALASLVAGSAAALAATDGDLDTTSEGTALVTLDVANLVRVTGLDDMALGSFSGTGDLTGDTAFCVYRNGTGLYDVTVSSANQAGTAFRASNGTDFLAYTVKFDEDNDAVDGATIAAGVAETALLGDDDSTSCDGVDNAAMQIVFAEADLLAAPTGAYADTLTVLVTPN